MRSLVRGRARRLGVVFAGTLMAFQVLAVIGATTASAAVTACTFSGGTLTIAFNGAGPDTVSQDVAKNILFDGAKTSTLGGTCGTSADANVANTTAINLTGPGGADVTDQSLVISMVLAGSTVDYGAINWSVDLGGSTAGDLFTVTNAASADSLTSDWGASGVDLNGDGNLDVVLANVEKFTALAGGGGDTINGAGSTATGAAFPSAMTITGGAGDDTLTGGAGNDTISGGAGDDTLAGGLGNDSIDGGLNTAVGDTVDYSGSTAGVTVTVNGLATGEGLDALTTVENVIGSPQADVITGDGGPNVITPGAGDDTVDGAAGSDTVDYSDATAAVTVDLGAGTATGGSGNDKLSHIENATGSDFNDSLTGNANDNTLNGGAGNDLIDGEGGAVAGDTLIGGSGSDTLDYSWATSVSLVLNCLAVNGTGAPSDTAPVVDTIKSSENAILTSGDDSFTGNEFPNTVWPNGGQNAMLGDCVAGGPTGGDMLNYSEGYTTGVTVNMAGGATAGDSALGFENAIGTAFADNITGNGFSNTLKGGGGADNLKGGTGDDTLMGGKGNDVMRGGSGDDDLFGGKGPDTAYGGAGTDLCRSARVQKGCELH